MPSDDSSDAKDTRLALAATGMVPEGVNLILTKALSLPPDLGSEPKTGPGPAEQAIVAGLLVRIDTAAPEALNGIDPRIRARGETRFEPEGYSFCVLVAASA